MKYKRVSSARCDIPHPLVDCEYKHREYGNQYYGSAGTRGNYFYLFSPLPVELENFTPKKGCDLFRYSSQAVRAVGSFPIVSVNLERGLVYFWDDGWMSRGLKLEYLCEKDVSKAEAYDLTIDFA
jgi:hypothetical protein